MGAASEREPQVALRDLSLIHIFRREPSDDRKSVFRSTILPPDTSMLKGSRIRELSEEICSIING